MIHKGQSKVYLDDKLLGATNLNLINLEYEGHRFDIVTRFCVYCHVSMEDYYHHGITCQRIMEPCQDNP